MPIIRHGYATQRRNGSTRTYRKARATTLTQETICAICHLPETHDDPFVSAHITAHAYGGSDQRTNLRAAHRSCNAKQGALTLA